MFHYNESAIAYLKFPDTQVLREQIVTLFSQEGMRSVERLSIPLDESPALQNNRWGVQILAGNSGWHALRCMPSDLWCDHAEGGSQARFVALCQTLGIPGFLLIQRDCNLEQAYQVLMEADSKGNVAVSGHWLTEGKGTEFYGYPLDNLTLQPTSAGLKKFWEESQSRDVTDIGDDSTELEKFSRHVSPILIGRESWDVARNLPELGGITLFFEWPAQDRPEPPPPKQEEIFYIDGTRAQRGDAVLLDFGSASGRVTNILYSGSTPHMLVVTEPGEAGQRGLLAATKSTHQVSENPCSGRCVSLLPSSVQFVERDSPNHIQAAIRFLEERTKAKAGDARAMLAYGLRFSLGKGVAQDGKTGYDWMVQAADHGSIEAQYLVGHQSKDPAKAARYWRMAAESGHAGSQFMLGRAYLLGEGVQKDYGLSDSWVELAFKQGHIAAHYNKGCIWGGIVKSAPDDDTSAVWFTQQAEAGDRVAAWVMGICAEYGRNGVLRNDTEAIRWYRMSAELGFVTAVCDLADKYERGKGVNQNLVEAVRLYMQAAEKVPTAMFKLGELYRDGRGVAQDYVEARYWLNEAFRAKHEGAERALNNLPNSDYQNGLRLLSQTKSANRPDPEAVYCAAKALNFLDSLDAKKLAFELYKYAANKRHPGAQYSLGFRYLRGIATAVDTERAIELYLWSAEQGYEYAQEALAAMFKQGEVVPKNLIEALYWQQKFATHSSPFPYLWLPFVGVLRKVFGDSSFHSK